MSKHGIEYAENNAFFIKQLDCQKKTNKYIYGAGYLVPEKNAAVAKAAVAKRTQKIKFQLSEIESKIVADLEENRKSTNGKE